MKTKTTLVILIFLVGLSLNAFAQDFPYISLGGHTDVARSVAFSTDGQTLVSGSYDRTIRVWEVGTGNQLRTILNAYHRNFLTDQYTLAAYGVALSPSGQIVASGGWDHYSSSNIGNIALWEVNTGERLWFGLIDPDWTGDISFSPDGQTLASGGSDNTIYLWEVSTGNLIRTFVGHTDAVRSVSFSPDGQLIASASYDNTIRLWAITGRHIRTFTGHTDNVYSVAFSPNGQMLASASEDTTIRLWDVGAGRHLRTLTGHTGRVASVSFSPDGQTVASAGEDSTVRLWEVSTGRHLHTLTGHAQPVYSVAFSPTEQKLASGHEDGNILLWELPATHLRIVPAALVSPAVGKQFTVDINIAGSESVTAFEVSLDVDATALRYVSGDYGDYLPAPPDVFYITPVVSEDNATVTLSGTSFTGAGSGDGTLATVTFEVVDTKASFIDVSDIRLTGSQGEDLHVLAHSTKIEAFPFGDVNEDSVVNIQDLVLVANSFGRPVPADGSPADVNGDGDVNVQDLVAVAAAFGGGAAGAPSALLYQASGQLTAADVQYWLTQAQQLNLADAISQRGILFLEQLLAALTPKETMLLANYPNPFNPETWIPYQLSDAADVRVTIYGMDGAVVRSLMLGHQPIGIYQDKSRAAYWDGRNAVGEPVASGVYFYTLTAGDFSATRKMLIRK